MECAYAKKLKGIGKTVGGSRTFSSGGETQARRFYGRRKKFQWGLKEKGGMRLSPRGGEEVKRTGEKSFVQTFRVQREEVIYVNAC